MRQQLKAKQKSRSTHDPSEGEQLDPTGRRRPTVQNAVSASAQAFLDQLRIEAES